MPWNECPMSELRLAFVKLVDALHYPVAQACRDFGISRKTGYQWLRRARQQPAQPLTDRSRRPHASPGRTPDDLERQILDVRDRYGWGGRKIRAFLQQRGLELPSRQTVQRVLQRHGRAPAPAPAAPPPQSFARSTPNELWQPDFKGPLEVAHRRVCPFDDHSRYLLVLAPCLDCTMATAWELLGQACADAGLPEAVLCDNAFGTRGQNPLGVSWFDARLIRLGVHPHHGRAYHPQTQGTIERCNRTRDEELWPRARRDTLEHFHADLTHWRTEVYNPLRPHEALGPAGAPARARDRLPSRKSPTRRGPCCARS